MCAPYWKKRHQLLRHQQSPHPSILRSACWYCVAQDGSQRQMSSQKNTYMIFHLTSVRIGCIIAQIQHTQHKNTEASDDKAKGTPSWTYVPIKIEVKPELRPFNCLPYLLSIMFSMSRISWYNSQHPHALTWKFRKTDIGEVRLQCSNAQSSLTFAHWCPL